jgi:hypothetical protein
MKKKFNLKAQREEHQGQATKNPEVACSHKVSKNKFNQDFEADVKKKP